MRARAILPLMLAALAALILVACARTVRQQAASHIQDGNYGLAEPLLRQALDQYSLDQNAYLQLGVVYRHTGRERLARLVFQQIARAKPADLVSEDTSAEFAGRPVADLANHYLTEMGEGPLYVSGAAGEVAAPYDRPDSVESLEREILGDQEPAYPSSPMSSGMAADTAAPLGDEYAPAQEMAPAPPLEPVQHSYTGQGQGYGVHVLSFERALNVEGGKQLLLRRFPVLLAGKQFRSQRVDMGDKGVFHRLYTGPYATREEAARVCAELKQAYGYCEVVPF